MLLRSLVRRLRCHRPSLQRRLRWGGYENTFTTNDAFTVIDGKLSLDSGTLKVQKLKIK